MVNNGLLLVHIFSVPTARMLIQFLVVSKCRSASSRFIFIGNLLLIECHFSVWSCQLKFAAVATSVNRHFILRFFEVTWDTFWRVVCLFVLYCRAHWSRKYDRCSVNGEVRLLGYIMVPDILKSSGPLDQFQSGRYCSRLNAIDSGISLQ